MRDDEMGIDVYSMAPRSGALRRIRASCNGSDEIPHLQAWRQIVVFHGMAVFQFRETSKNINIGTYHDCCSQLEYSDEWPTVKHKSKNIAGMSTPVGGRVRT